MRHMDFGTIISASLATPISSRIFNQSQGQKSQNDLDLCLLISMTYRFYEQGSEVEDSQE